MVLTLQEPSSGAARDTGQSQTHPRAPSYCWGTGSTRAYSQCPDPEGQGSHGVSGLAETHSMEESRSHAHLQLVGTSQRVYPLCYGQKPDNCHN